MKKRGSILLETIVSIMILTITISILASVIKGYKENIIIRQRREALSRISYCIMQELKYNYSLEELKSYGETISIRNHEGILEELQSFNLLTLETGPGIEIEVNNRGGNLMINTRVYFNEDKYDFVVEREFTKWR